MNKTRLSEKFSEKNALRCCDSGFYEPAKGAVYPKRDLRRNI